MTDFEMCRRGPARPWGTVLAVAALGAIGCANTNNNASPDAALGTGGARPDGAVVDVGSDASDLGRGDGGDAAVAGRDPGYLWYAGGALSGFTQAQTRATNSDGPGWLILPSYPATNFHDLLFDAAGNLWAIPISGDHILRIPAAHLGDSRPVPDLVAASAALKSADSLVFDARGNLWVMSSAGGGTSIANIVRFDDPRALSGTQTLVASLTIAPAAGDTAKFTQGTAVAFDKVGNLWFAAISDVLRLEGVASMQGNVVAAPAATISTGDSIVSLAFDVAGSLWITGASNGYVAVRIDNPAALTGTIRPSPAARVHLATTTARFAGGMAFDADGALWVVMSDSILKLPGASALVGEVSPTPTVVLGNVAFPDLATKLIVRPTPAGLPIF